VLSDRAREVDEVFTSRPSEFVRARDAVAARLRKAGRRSEAAEVARLRRPSPALWAVNQLGHEHAGELGAFLTAVDQLRTAQLGRGGGGVNQAATRQRNALQNLVALATGILIAAHLAATPAVLQRVSATLLGAAADTDARERLRHGRLTEEHAAPGFEAFAGIAPAARQERPAPAREKPQRKRRARPPSREQERAAERDARAAGVRASKLEREARRLRQRAETSAKAVERLRAQLRESEERLTHERQAAEEAERSAERARGAVDGGDVGEV